MLFQRTNQIRLQQEKKTLQVCAFLDFSTVFDSISQKKLLRRLENIGFDENGTILIENYLSGRTQRVVLNKKESD